ncbi:MAG: carboxypeptidase-like regulatory domain-containing protein [Myxococcaceae bacterium]|nr:carboxypeptidase-like regulatory domain-containing protein [Myxococcaceae bacterium]MCI0670450.1 carboxypeptidase-like regulatory domain-containing protein [Myxococcaceae bacterium]
MRKVWLIMAAVCVLVGAVLALQARPAPEGTRPERVRLPTFEPVGVKAGAGEGLTLTGRVLDSAGQPVPGAEVMLASSAQQSLASVACEEDALPLLSCPARETALTLQDLLAHGQGLLTPGATTRADPEGRFRFEHLTGVSFTVWAASPTHGAAVRERAAPGEAVELYLPPRRSIEGVVSDEEGRPVPGARVWAVSRRLPLGHETRAGTDGRFILEGLGEGPFSVLATAPHLLPTVASPIAAGAQPVQLVLTTPRALEVQVRRDGRPADALVRLEADHLRSEASTTQGIARFEGLYPDGLVVTAVAGSASAVPLAVTLREHVTRVTVELAEGGRLLVTVLDEAGQPVPTPTLRLWTPQGERVEERRTATGELVVFGPLGAGDYVLEGEAQGFRGEGLPVRVKPGDTPLELTLARGTAIAGRVLDVYGRPAAGISVLVQPTADAVQADAEGRFTALVPSPGLYTLHAHHSDWGGVERRVSAPDTGVELSLEPRASVEVVAQGDGRRVEGASAQLSLGRDSVFRSDRMSGPDGRIPVRGLPAGTYELTASHPDFLPSEPMKVTVVDGQTLEVTAALRPGARLVGEVVDERGAPVSGAVVGVVPRVAEPAASDAKGRFTVRALPGDRAFRVEAYHPEYDQQGSVNATAGGEPVRLVMKRRMLYRGRVVAADGSPVRSFKLNDRDVVSGDGRFELPLGAQDATGSQLVLQVEAPGFEPRVLERPRVAAELGDIVLESAPILTGLVREQGGAPVAEAVVTCDACDESVLSGPDGRFALHHPAAVGTLSVSARKGPLSGSAPVATGQSTVDVTLEPALPLTGTVFGPDGRPMPGVALEVTAPESPEGKVAVTGADGRYDLRLPAGTYRLTVGHVGAFTGAPVVLARVSGAGAQVDVGPAPGTATLAVKLRPEQGRALWIVRGELASLGNPPRELMNVPYGQMAYQPRAERVVFEGLAPGRYTVVWGGYHASGAMPPQVRVVDVPRQAELDLTGGG